MLGGNGSKSSEGSENDILFIAAGVFIMFALIYYFFHNQIITGLFFIKYYELSIIKFFLPATGGVDAIIKYGYEHPQVVNLHELVLVADLVGNWLKYPLAVISAILAVVLYFSHPSRLYTDIEKMETLSSKMADYFPAIKVVQDIDLIKTSIDSGPWAMALTPVEWMKKHKLLYRDAASKSIKVDRLRAKLAFTSQLGPQWRGVEYLNNYERAIFAALAAFVNYDRKRGEEFLEQMAASATQANLKTMSLDFNGVDELIKKYGHSTAVKTIVSEHAYVYTVFARMLTQARSTGIVANSLYLWLKPIDRCLWYVLNSVGRKAVFVEVGGVYAHFKAECELKMPIKQPLVEEAVNGLEEVLKIKIIRDIA